MRACRDFGRYERLAAAAAATAMSSERVFGRASGQRAGENAVAARNAWRTRRGGYADGVDFSGRACVNHRGTNAVGPIADFPCGGRRQLAHNVYLNFRICNRRLQVDWSPRGGWTAAWDECGGTAAWDRRGNGCRGTGGELSRTSRVSRVADSSCRSCLQSTFRSLWSTFCSTFDSEDLHSRDCG